MSGADRWSAAVGAAPDAYDDHGSEVGVNRRQRQRKLGRARQHQAVVRGQRRGVPVPSTVVDVVSGRRVRIVGPRWDIGALSAMSKPALKELAGEHGVRGRSIMRREQLIDALVGTPR